jgi:2,4-diketo-3-deoxy-L-fuconate hydrolase
MKLLRYGPKGAEKPGLIDAEAQSATCRVTSPISPAELSPEGLAKLAAIDPASLPLVEGSRATACRHRHVGKFVAIGLNYADHAAESNLPIPEEPVVFTEGVSCLRARTIR